MKKRLNKNEKKVLENIRNVQLRALVRLKERAQLLQRTAEETIKKIESKGIDNYYSSNHDCLKYAQQLWSTSLRLGELKRLEDDIRGTFTSLALKKAKKKDI